MEKSHKKIDVSNKEAYSRLTPHDSRGFTLIEVIMVIILLGIIGSIAATIIYQGARSYGEEEVRKDLTTQGRIAIERMAREIRLVNCIASGNNCTPDNTTITFWTAAGFRFVNINYEGRGFQTSGTDLVLCSVSDCTASDILASNVSSLSFTYYDNAGGMLTPGVSPVGSIWTIVAALTLARDNQSVNFRIQIHPRSFK